MTVVLQKFKTIRQFTGHSSDTKPTLTAEDVGAEFYETNTSELWIWYGAGWKIPTTVTTIPPIEVGAEVGQSTRVDFTVNNSVVYKAAAAAGTSDASALWRISRLTIASDNDVVEEWADGVSTYIKVWNDRLTYTYS